MNYQDKSDNHRRRMFFPPRILRAPAASLEEVWGLKPKRIQPPVAETGFTTNS